MKHFYFFGAFFFGNMAIIYSEGPEKLDCLEKEKALALLETADDLLKKARETFPACKEDLNSKNGSECAGKKSLAYIEISRKLISGVRENFPTCSKPIVSDENIRDCSEILASGRNESGVYTIWPKEPSTTGKPLQVYCDMDTDGGGWTVIQRRGKFPVQQDFYKDWESYKNGFGNITQEFWLGNENIRVLCERGCKIRFELHAENGEKGFAIYQSFFLSSSYVIQIKDYSGDAGDAMRYQHNHAFSTKDKGNTEKAQQLKGGWWYEDTTVFSHLNGVYKPGTNEPQTVNWYPWRQHENLATVEIKVRPQ